MVTAMLVDHRHRSVLIDHHHRNALIEHRHRSVLIDHCHHMLNNATVMTSGWQRLVRGQSRTQAIRGWPGYNHKSKNYLGN